MSEYVRLALGVLLAIALGVSYLGRLDRQRDLLIASLRVVLAVMFPGGYLDGRPPAEGK